MTICAVTALTARPAEAAAPQAALDIRAGTTGVGLDIDLGLSRYIGARVGYSYFRYDRTFHTTDVAYDGRLKLSMVSGLLDWYVLGGGLRVTAGAVWDGTRADVTGRPAQGRYTLSGVTYTQSEVGSLAGRLTFGHPVSPYLGIGWGNPTGAGRHVHFLVDLGVIYGGTPKDSLTAECGPAAPPGSALCAQLQNDVAAERHRLDSSASLIRWYPVLDLGLAYRF